MRSGHIRLFLIVLIFQFLFLFPASVCVNAAEKAYSIQTGSFSIIENAQRQFDSLKRIMDEQEVDILRIENIGGYYKVRLGIFTTYSEAEEFLQTINHSYSGAFVLNVPVESEDVIKNYAKSFSKSDDKGIDESVTLPDEQKPRMTDKGVIERLITEERYDEAIDAYREAIAVAEVYREKAVLHKELGDLLISRDDYESAAEEFIRALSLPHEFSEDERLQMAIYISQADRYDEAILELRSILYENPGNLEARKNLVKVLTWAERHDEAIGEYRTAINKSKDDREKGQLHKEIGDIFVAQGNYQKAAQEYIHALRLSREFTEDERLQMAMYMSWGNRLDEAIIEYRTILNENPGNMKARVNLAQALSWADRLDEAIIEYKTILNENPGDLKARVNLAQALSWADRLDEAIEEADKVLKESPDNKDALLVKSNALQWKGKYRKAIPLYKGILDSEERFDARIGLAYSYLYSGNITATRRSRNLLEPGYPYQEKQFQAFKDRLDRIVRPHFDLGYNYYRDEDDNIRHRYLLGFGFWLGNWKSSVLYEHTDAEDPIRKAHVEDVSFVTYSKLTEFFGIGGGLGISYAHNDATEDYVNGYLKADLAVLGRRGNVISVGSIATGLYDETAQLIENGIRLTNYNIYISQEIFDKLILYCGYTYNDYSDDNYSNDFQIVPSYIIYSGDPTITLRYRFRYLDFARHTDSGYFNPETFFSHQLYASVFHKKNKFYMYLDPYIGQQSFTLYDDRSDDFLVGGYGSLGYELTKNTAFEVNAEGGNYALGTAGGWNYYIVGLKFIITL